jgi:polyisoprenoid-binding protein YceI
MSRRNIIIIAVAAVIVVAAGVWIFYPRQAADLHHTAAGTATVCGTPIPTGDLTKYSIVPTQTTASYSVHEDLILGGVGNKTTVGKTQSVQGSLLLRTAPAPEVTQVHIVVDLSTLQTDSAQRDNFVRGNYLNTDQFPTATFDSTCVQGLPATYSDGQTVSFQMTGNLQLHGKTNQETFTMQGKVVGNTITGTGTTTLFMTDFGISPPDIGNIAIVDNKVVLTLAFTAQSA